MFLSKFFSNARAKVMMALAGLTMVLGVGAGITVGISDAQNEVVETKATKNFTTSDYIYVDVSEHTDWLSDSATIRAGCMWGGQNCWDGDNWKNYTGIGTTGTLVYDNVYKCFFPSYNNAVGAGAVRASSNGELWNHKFVSDSDISSGKFVTITGWDQTGDVYTTATVTVREIKSNATGTTLKTRTFPIGSGKSKATSAFTSQLSSYSGYTFDDYYTTASGNTKSSTVSSTVTIYARFTPNNYTVTGTASTGVSSVYFSTDSGATAAAGTSFAMDSTVYCFAVLKAGYQARDGWTLVAGTANTAEAKYCVSSGRVTTAGYAFGTISALPQSYSITIDQRGGTGTESENYTFSTGSQNVNLGTPTKEGKDFAGYVIDTQPSGGTATIAGAVLTIPGGAYGSIALHATWSDGTYTITFNANGGDASAPSSMNPGVGVEVDLPNYTGAKTGYTFTGWNTASDGSGDHYDVGECTPEVAKDGTLALFAEWSINSHTVSATTGDGVSSVYFSTSSTAPSGAGTSFNYGATVYAFAVKKAGWTAPNTWTLVSDNKYRVASHAMPDENYSFGTISATAASFDITYDTNGGAAISKGSYTMRGSNQTVTLTAPTKTGNTFTGYTITTNTSGSASSISSKTTLNIPADAYGAVTVKANWSVNSYSITYKDKGNVDFSGSHGAGYLTSYTYGTGATLDTPTKIGYKFGGYYANSACTGDPVTSIGASETGAKTYYAKWDTYTDFWVSIGGGSKIGLTSVGSGGGSTLYELSMSATQAMYGGQSITFYRGATSGTATPFTYADGLTADSAAGNNVVTAGDNTWTVHNYAVENIFFKVQNDGTFQFWVGGYGAYSGKTNGVSSGSTFYVQDLLKKNGASSNFGSDGCQIGVYFFNPVEESAAINAWSATFCSFISTTDDVDLYSVTVPQFNGHDMKWGSVIVVRFLGSATVLSFDTAIKNDGVYNGVKINTFSSDVENGVQVTSWSGSGDWEYPCSGNAFMYTDGGLSSGQGVYIDLTTTPSGWSVDDGYGVYVYFFSVVNGDGNANAWTAKATLVPGETKIYECEVPQYKSENVQWAKLIVVNNNTTAFRGNGYQTQDLWYNSTMTSNQHVTFDGTFTWEGKANAATNTSYTDSTRAESWGTRFIGTNVKCSGGDNPSISTDNWTAARNEYNAAPKAVRTIITESEAAASDTAPGATNLQLAVRRYDYIIGKYGTSAHPDFASRSGTTNYSYVPPASAFVPGASKGNDSPLTTTLWIVLASGLAGLAAIGTAYFVSKKKRHQA